MCPITLTIVASTMAATMSAIASGAGVAAALAAGTAAASAAATGAGLGAAIGAGAAASAAATATAAGVAGTTALTVGGAVGFGTTAGTGIAGTALTTGAVLTEVVALVGLGQGIHQQKEAKRRAHEQRKNASETALVQREIAADQASREVRAEAEQGVSDTIKAAEHRGQIHNLQNRSDTQIAALIREVDRGEQANKAALETRLLATSGAVRDTFRSVEVNERSAFRAARGPSTLGFALQIGSTALGSAVR